MDESQTPTEESQLAMPNLDSVDLSTIPPILVLSAHLKGHEAKDIEETLRRHGAQPTDDVSKAKVFIGKVGTKKRSEFELRARRLKVEEFLDLERTASPVQVDDEPASKRRKVEGSRHTPQDEARTRTQVADDSETEDEFPTLKRDTHAASPTKSREESEALPVLFESPGSEDIIWVIKVGWLNDCIAKGTILPLGVNLVYTGKVIERPPSSTATPKSIIPFFAGKTTKIIPASRTNLAPRPESGQDILERAKSDLYAVSSRHHHQPTRSTNSGSRRFDGATFASSSTSHHGQVAAHTAHLLKQSTSEYEGDDSDLPPAPKWVKKDIKYSCQRFTPLNGPNDEFIGLLKKIRIARTLINDEIGIRAYSTIIAAIAAYPYELRHPREVLRIPGCDTKAAELYVEWKNTGHIKAVDDFEEDEAMKVLRLFYDIWGVGAKTARNFYYGNHWTELDDIVEFGWNDLDRVQQIGVKYYEELLNPIPRSEVEQIAEVVRQHAVRLRDDRITVTIVGGYRRGKAASGDVDMIISHHDLESTANLVRDIIQSLEDEEWITHTLTMSLHNTERGQSTLPFRTTRAAGAGFDTLDKALVVWQDPHWPTRERDLAENPRAKNPNIHRRVDIIIAPWRTVGCAVMGWSGGTTFQRDLRRYAKAIKGWKFDSSGIRDRSTGEVVQLEGPNGVDGTPEDAERIVFEGLGLEYIPPEMRCTN
ncbi:Nucleotidyltransferase [Aaosphaeria arxii CBS 175.79]|uniref:DNA-directed DNA polymerase n=1 Tax=Aaosphaeria arxii CBS 175.79 TaxID=1450172 RepID=A0A6A5XRH5_9PLEO|nr:Nucleotidyltransferase [Aaosphaeria arxii CBS 175.79]KAF2015437.1 Nucleotidyltransferase [Aaosphaeria arxii CBS 175.79]